MGGTGGGKGSGAGGSQIRDYYASFAGVICYGPVDELVSMLIDGKVEWQPGSPVQRSNTSNPYIFDVDGWGRVYFYWGTETQTLTDPVLSIPSRNHPPYRRRCLAVFEKFLCGRERASVPDISFVVRRVPKQGVITGAAATLDSEGQANPACAAAEMLTDGVVGAGLGNSSMDAASFQAAADELFTNASNTYLSIEQTGKSTVRNMLSQLSGYCGLWVKADNMARASVGLYPDSGTATGLPIYTRHDLSTGSEPQYEIKNLESSDGRVILKFSNKLDAFEDDYAQFSNGVRRDILGKDDPAELDRRWIRRPGQAAYLAAKLGTREGIPFAKFSLTLREERADGIEVGSRLVFNDTHYGISLLAHVVERVGDSDLGGEVTLKLETERVLGDFAGTGAGDLHSTEADEQLDQAYNWNPLQATSALLIACDANNGGSRKLFFLGGKEQETSIGTNIYFKKAGADFQFLGTNRAWANPVALDTALSSSGATIATNVNITRLSSGGGLGQVPASYIGWDEINPSPAADEIEDDSWLMIIVSMSNPKLYEITTLRSMTPTGGFSYSLSLTRGRLGTPKRSWQPAFAGGPILAICYLVSRYDLQFFSHNSLDDIANGSSVAARTVTLAAPPYSARQTLSPDNSYIRDLEIT